MIRSSFAMATVTALLLVAAWPTTAQAEKRPWLSKTGGVFQGPNGVLTLSYEGEGTVNVLLKTKQCKVDIGQGTAGTQNEQVTVLHDKKGDAVLVIFYTKDYLFLHPLKGFYKPFCKDGVDVEGRYTLVGLPEKPGKER